MTPVRPMLRQDRDGATAVLTLDHPERRNALAVPMRQALADALAALAATWDDAAATVDAASG